MQVLMLTFQIISLKFSVNEPLRIFSVNWMLGVNLRIYSFCRLEEIRKIIGWVSKKFGGKSLKSALIARHLFSTWADLSTYFDELQNSFMV